MDPLLAFILGFIAGWYVVLFVWWMATRLCVRAGDMAGPGSAAMTDADRLRRAADELDRCMDALESQRMHRGSALVAEKRAVAALLRAVADMRSGTLELLPAELDVIAAAHRLTDTILGEEK